MFETALCDHTKLTDARFQTSDQDAEIWALWWGLQTVEML